MISIERSFYQTFPRLSSGKGRALSRPVVAWLRRVACETEVNATMESLRGARGLDFVAEALERLRFSYRVAPTDRANIPAEGRVVIVANHPLGALDALSLLDLVGSVRRDVRILANQVLTQLEPLQELMVGCDVFGSDSRPRLREAFRALENEQALIVFPAGEVSRVRPDGVRDGPWNDGFVRFAKRTGACVLPIHIAAQNSPAFYGFSMLAKPLATLMLPREMFAARDQRITLTVGAPIAPLAMRAVDAKASDSGSRQLAAAMRRHVYRIASRKPPLFVTSNTVAHPESSLAVRRALAAAEPLGETRDGKRIMLLQPSPRCVAMREIGRLRELTFRQVGEGTGLKRDLDNYDLHYQQLVLWDDEAMEIVGAYRLAEVAQVLSRCGREGLYSASLFDYSPASSAFLQQAVELGRSFVQPRYWGSRSLDYLWQGIGAYLRTRPQVRYLLGPVSLSAEMPETARALIVETHRHFFADPQFLAQARNPYRTPPDLQAAVATALAPLNVVQGLSWLNLQLRACGASLPVLYRQYVDLCEHDGVTFMDFGVDPAFGHCIDGLIRIDLQRLKPAKRARYLKPPAGSVSSPIG